MTESGKFLIIRLKKLLNKSLITRHSIQVINWDINNNKIESITKDLIEDSRKRVQEIISGQKKDMNVLKVHFKQ